MLEAFGNAFRIKELRTKLLITAGLLAVCRVGVFIPVPGVNFNWIKGFIERSAGGEPGGIASFLNLADMFNHPMGIVATPEGRVYIVDTHHHKIQRYVLGAKQ